MQMRLASDADFNFIASSYLKSYRNSPEAKYLINEIYWDVYKERLRNMLVKSQVLVATNGEPDNILGYIIVGEHHGVSVAHYVYVKYSERGQGVAQALLKEAIPEFGQRMVLCTHTARGFKELQEKYKLIYNTEYVK